MEQVIQERVQTRGSIEVICGSMFSGKTEELIRRIKRAQFAKQKIVMFKPTIDVRYSVNDVVSHDKKSFASIPVVRAKDMLEFTVWIWIIWANRSVRCPLCFLLPMIFIRCMRFAFVVEI